VALIHGPASMEAPLAMIPQESMRVQQITCSPYTGAGDFPQQQSRQQVVHQTACPVMPDRHHFAPSDVGHQHFANTAIVQKQPVLVDMATYRDSHAHPSEEASHLPACPTQVAREGTRSYLNTHESWRAPLNPMGSGFANAIQAVEQSPSTTQGSIPMYKSQGAQYYDGQGMQKTEIFTYDHKHLCCQSVQ
jgi:hypothetical protein